MHAAKVQMIFIQEEAKKKCDNQVETVICHVDVERDRNVTYTIYKTSPPRLHMPRLGPFFIFLTYPPPYHHFWHLIHPNLTW